MAIHFPKNLSYEARFNAWVSGICPFCGHEGVLGSTTPTGRFFKCPSCGADNPFTNPRYL